MTCFPCWPTRVGVCAGVQGKMKVSTDSLQVYCHFLFFFSPLLDCHEVMISMILVIAVLVSFFVSSFFIKKPNQKPQKKAKTILYFKDMKENNHIKLIMLHLSAIMLLFTVSPFVDASFKQRWDGLAWHEPWE